MAATRTRLTTALVAAVLVLGCASKPRQLMPTPVVYQQPGGVARVVQSPETRGGSTDVDLLYITDRGAETDPEGTLPYGQTRAKSIAFGTARVRIGPHVSWETLERESRLANRTRDLNLSLGRVTELGRFPQEPYAVEVRADGSVHRAAADLRAHRAADRLLREEVQQRLTRSPTKEIVLYVHGFNETFATAAFTAAELCHFLGREPVCAFFTWPASSTGNVLISYTSTTESAQYAENHLKKVIRSLATTPGVERVQLLAHSRGTAVLMAAVRDLFAEAIAAGKEPSEALRVDNLVLFSPDIDVDIISQDVTAEISDPDIFTVWPSGRLPQSLRGGLTIYSSPRDKALLLSRILFRSRNRVGGLRAEDVPAEVQHYLEPFEKVNLIIYEGRRTDPAGHSYFTTNPRVSSDLVELLRYDKRPGQPGRELIKVGPIVWKFPPAAPERLQVRRQAAPGGRRAGSGRNAAVPICCRRARAAILPLPNRTCIAAGAVNATAFLLIVTGVLLNAVAQLALKASVRETGSIDLSAAAAIPTLTHLAAQPWLYLGLGCYVVSVGIWILALSRVDVSVAYPMLSLGYVVNALAAWAWLGEELNPVKVLGIGIIIVGVYVLARA